MSAKSIDDIVKNFVGKSSPRTSTRRYVKPITLWVPSEYAAKYERLQKKTKRQFCGVLREVVESVIDQVQADPDAA